MNTNTVYGILTCDMDNAWKIDQLRSLQYQVSNWRKHNTEAIEVYSSHLRNDPNHEKADTWHQFLVANQSDYDVHTKELDSILEAIDALNEATNGTQLELF